VLYSSYISQISENFIGRLFAFAKTGSCVVLFQNKFWNGFAATPAPAALNQSKK